MAHLPIFTQSEYRRSLLGHNANRGVVIPASWIDPRWILTDDEAVRGWERRLGMTSDPLRLMFAGRLVEDKGIRTLLDALRILESRRVGVHVDIFGQGPLAGDCEAAATGRGLVTVRTRGVIPYDESFFRTLDSYDAIVIPSLGDEQPRIVFDAESRALPILASATSGIRECVEDGVNGYLSVPGDPVSLADVIEKAAADRNAIRFLGMNGIVRARQLTHVEMHRQRAILIRKLYGCHL